MKGPNGTLRLVVDTPFRKRPVAGIPLRTLAREGLLSSPAYARACEIEQAEGHHVGLREAIARHATWFSICLLVAGTIFFVAANWQAFGFYTRVGLVALAMVANCVYAAHLGLDGLRGRAVALLGGLCFGPVMAIYGQHFQTGADAHQLFATWMLVMAVFALGTRFVGAWVVVWALAHVSTLSWMEQILGLSPDDDDGVIVLVALMVGNLAVWVGLESANDLRAWKNKAPCFGSRASTRWLVDVCALGFLGPGAILTATVIFESRVPAGAHVAATLFVLVAPAAVFGYLRRWADMVVLSLALVALAFVLTMLMSKAIFDGLDLDEIGVMLVGLLVCVLVWIIARVSLTARSSELYRSATFVAETLETQSNDDATGATTQWTMAELWQRLADEELVSAIDDKSPPQLRAALGYASDASTPVLTSILVAVGTWIGALMIGGYLLIGTEIHETPLAAGILGSIMFIAAIVISRGATSIALVQLVWIAAVSGQLLMTAGMFKAFDNDATEHGLPVLLFALQIPAIVFARQRAYQIASVIACGAHLSWWVFASELQASFVLELAIVATYAVIARLWCRDDPTQSVRMGVWAYGLPIAATVAMLCTGQRPWLHELFSRSRTWSVGPLSPSDLLVGLGLAAVCAWIAAKMIREGGAAKGRHRVALFGAAIVVTLLGTKMPGVLAGIILVTLGLWRRSPYLVVLAYLHLGGFLGLYCYELSLPLLGKSVTVLATGAVAWALARAASSAPTITGAGDRRGLAGQITDLRRIAWGLTLALAIPCWAIWDKYSLIARGQPMLLELRPVDPRSLMQGDYMSLAYKLADRIGTRYPGEDGHVVVELDEHSVARFLRIDDGQPLKDGERRLLFRARDGRPTVRLGAESYLFEEGSAQIYEVAEYGELVVDESGRSVLIGLRDKKHRRLGPALHDTPTTLPSQ